MPTWDKDVGNSGTMRMVDNGSTVVLQVRVGWSGTNWGSVGYSWSGAGGSGSGSFGYPGGSVWVTVRTLTVNNSGNVSWTINNTGTSEFGGPHTQTQYITRDTIPPAPTPLGIDQETHTSLRARFSSTGDGGSPIIRWELGYGLSSTSTQEIITSSGTSTVSSLLPGRRYYFWARGVNAVGTGPWSARFQGDTIAGVKVRHSGTWKDAIPYVRVSGVWKPAEPYARSAGSWRRTTY